MAKYRIFKISGESKDVVVTVTASDTSGIRPSTKVQAGFSSQWSPLDQVPRYQRVQASNGTYTFETKEKALAAGLEAAMKSMSAERYEDISAQPVPLPEPSTKLASQLADLQERLRIELLDPFAEAIHQNDQGRIGAYRTLANHLRHKIEQLESALDGQGKKSG